VSVFERGWRILYGRIPICNGRGKEIWMDVIGWMACWALSEPFEENLTRPQNMTQLTIE